MAAPGDGDVLGEAGIMPSETIVAVFDLQQQADAAVRQLEAAGVAAVAIRCYAPSQTDDSASQWAWLFDDGTTAPTEPSFTSRGEGAFVLTVTVSSELAPSTITILTAHAPAAIDERPAGYELHETSKRFESQPAPFLTMHRFFSTRSVATQIARRDLADRTHRTASCRS